jgi:predicted ATP-binding protein involved in virulence
LPAWQAHLQDLNTPEMAKSIRNSIFESIKSDFMNALPLGAIFIPASRAIAALSDRIKSQDVFINNFFDLKDFALSFNNISNNYINKILKIKNIFLDDQKQPIIELPDGRKITPLQLASGQQELLYLLILISDLNRAGMEFSSQYSVFIEEPSAHLFPQEQKMTMEFLAKSFSELQKHGYRFIISTHSPYVLNVINNLLEKERLLNKIKPSGKENELRNKLLNLPFPGLSVNEVAAYMIESDGCVNSMISTGDDEQYIYSSVIDKIDDVISNDVNELLNIAEAINK